MENKWCGIRGVPGTLYRTWLKSNSNQKNQKQLLLPMSPNDVHPFFAFHHQLPAGMEHPSGICLRRPFLVVDLIYIRFFIGLPLLLSISYYKHFITFIVRQVFVCTHPYNRQQQ